MPQPAANPYYLTREARAALKRRAREIREHLAWRRAMRQLQEAVAQTQRPQP